MATYYRNMMNFKRFEDNHNFIIDINNSDNIYALKNKLSRVTKLNCNKIILIHKNRVLKNDKLITDYNIDENDFVLFSDEEIDYCHDEKLNRNKQNYLIKYFFKCWKKLTKYYKPKKNERTYKSFDQCRKCYNTNYCAICNGADMCAYGNNGIPYCSYPDKSFISHDLSYYQQVFIYSRSGRRTEIKLTVESIIRHYGSFEIELPPHNISNLINIISTKIGIPQKNIKLFLDKNQSRPIKSNIDISKFFRDTPASQSEICIEKTDNGTYAIYYNIESDFDNLVKLEKLGKGSFGTVFKCISIETKKEIAVKKLEIPTTDKTKEDKLSFERELQVYSKHSDHPRIVKYERNFQTENAIFLVIEYMKGGSLGSYLKKNGPLSEDKIKKYSKQILEALQYLHEQQILHRDIKSDNILLDEDDNVKLCDFGLSKILTDLATKDFLNGVCQTFVGTVNYMAPEVMNDEPYGASADVWSFGATVVEMVTGFPPYHKMGVCKVVKMISESKKIYYNYPNNLSGNLKSFIDSCLQSDPTERLTSEQLMKHLFFQICSIVTFL